MSRKREPKSEAPSTSLEKRLISYGAMAAAVAATGAAPPAEATIVPYTSNAVLSSNGFLSWNMVTGAVTFNNSGVERHFSVSRFGGTGGPGPTTSPMPCTTLCTYAFPFVTGVSFIARAIAPGALIRHASASENVSSIFMNYANTWTVPLASGNYFGLKFKIGDDFYYGWAEYSIAGGEFTLHRFAYEDCAGQGIHVGAETGGASCSEVPEPHPVTLLALGAAGLMALRRKKKAA